jgi:hypothetical protein
MWDGIEMDQDVPGDRCSHELPLCRRVVLQAGLAAAVAGIATRAVAQQEENPARSERPKEGDQFVFIGGDKDGLGSCSSTSLAVVTR